MSVTIDEFNLICQLTALRQKILRNYKNKDLVLTQINKATELISSVSKRTKEFVEWARVARESLDQFKCRIVSAQTTGDFVGILSFSLVLDTHYDFIRKHGEELEKVAWLQNAITSFLENFGYLSTEQTKHENLEPLMLRCAIDIVYVYSNDFSKGMKRCVFNYSIFLETLVKLAINVNDLEQVPRSNIFGK